MEENEGGNERDGSRKVEETVKGREGSTLKEGKWKSSGKKGRREATRK